MTEDDLLPRVGEAAFRLKGGSGDDIEFSFPDDCDPWFILGIFKHSDLAQLCNLGVMLKRLEDAFSRDIFKLATITDAKTGRPMFTIVILRPMVPAAHDLAKPMVEAIENSEHLDEALYWRAVDGEIQKMWQAMSLPDRMDVACDHDEIELAMVEELPTGSSTWTALYQDWGL